MLPLFVIFKKLGRKLRSFSAGSAGIVAAVIVYSTISEYLIENKIPDSGIHNIFNSLWWTMQTITTVGYGDTPVYGTLGRINAMAVMIVGIGSLGLFFASFAALLSNAKIMGRLGMLKVRMNRHVIVCNYDSAARDIIENAEKRGVPVVLVSENEINEPDMDFSFVRGSCLDEHVLERAGIRNCDTMIILAGRHVNEMEDAKTDAMTILTGMKVKKMNPDAFTIAEILLEKSSEHAEAVGIDEVVVRGTLSSSLLSRAIDLRGLSKVMISMLNGTGSIKIREDDSGRYKGMKIGDVTESFMKAGKFIIGLRKGNIVTSRIDSSGVMDHDSIIYIERTE